MKCLNCTRFGHTKTHCKPDRLCAQCSKMCVEDSCTKAVNVLIVRGFITTSRTEIVQDTKENMKFKKYAQ